MNDPAASLSIVTLFLNADPVVKGVLVLLLAAYDKREHDNPRRQAAEAKLADKRLKACVSALRDRELREIIAGVKQEVALHAQAEPQSDDITMLAVKYNGQSKDA